ncbi:nucleoside recognition domain-containing protein [Allopusillimonas ginsengisoli]|uniref:nucleoside recognition domain-containing protein n=1 Tax=Allopusillimonas ginsengisoli TaxID=453575 RepID=UPI001FD6A99E|nr:nucleoside recognition domain-containing protein [Allopusillimonas ginsengisoli]
MTVAKLMVPVMLVVHLADQFGLVALAGQWIAPAMSLLNLPPEAGIIWATTVFTGIFGGIATLATLAPSLDMTSAQLSALCAMMLFSHAIPVEQAIVRKAGASFWATAALRLGTAVFYGGMVSWASQWTGVLDSRISFEWMTTSAFAAGAAPSGIVAWMASTAYSMFLVFVIITILAAALDALERLGVTRRITAAMMPLLKFSGLNAQVAPVTTVGVLLGLTYGGALIIEEAKKQNFSARTRFLALSWLSLSHSLIEDTLLVLALGANIWVVLVGRVILTLLIVAALANLTNSGDWRVAGSAARQS